tara:strand:+ start:1006 stop:1176 length:171 start_codon:yes stop_codon:yes gene_type:complete
MSNNYSTTKDLGKATAILVFMMVGVPMLIAMSYEDYPKYCKMSIILPCIGVLIDEN